MSDRTFLQLRHNATPPTVADGAAIAAQCDAQGNLLVAGSFSPGPPAPSVAPSTYIAPTDQVCAAVGFPGARRVVQLRANNENSVPMWLLLIDKASTPVDGDAAVWSLLVPGGDSKAEVWGTYALALASGLAWAWSITPEELTLPSEFSGSSVSIAFFTA